MLSVRSDLPIMVAICVLTMYWLLKPKPGKKAWEFQKFLGSKEAADIQAKSGTVIPAFNNSQDPWVKANPKFHLQVFIDELKYAQSLSCLPGNPEKAATLVLDAGTAPIIP